MFKSMTKSLQIPHFLYSDELFTDTLTLLRTSINADLATRGAGAQKISYMPILIKSLSVALAEYPLLNAHLATDKDAPGDAAKATLMYRSSHNIAIAMDSPAGLIVPVVKS